MNSNYILRDWLGTPRVTLDGSGTVVQASDIAPYGRVMDLRTYVAGAEADRYRFTGHAHDAESGYDYHGARYYQPELGRYLGVDVMAVNYYAWSSYNYVMGNPIMLKDLDGRDTTYVFNDRGRYLTKINDNMRNQVHFITQQDYDDILTSNECATCTSNEFAQQIRSQSMAFIGRTSAMEMKMKYQATTAKTKREIGGFTHISATKELAFWQCTECANPNNPTGMAIDLYGFNQSKFDKSRKWFSSWHTHPILVTQSYHPPSVADGKAGQGAEAFAEFGIGRISGGPGLIITDMGITVYRHSSSTYSAHTTTDGAPDPQNTFFGHSWLLVSYKFFK